MVEEVLPQGEVGKMRRNLLILIGVLVGLIVVALILERPFGGGRKEEIKPLFPGFDPQAVLKVEIRDGGTTTVLKKTEDGWTVETARNYPADEEAVKEMFDEVKGMMTEELVSRDPSKHPRFRVNEDGVEVKMFGEGDKLLAHLFVGKSGPDYISTYVRRANSNDVYLIRRTLRPVFAKGKTGWCSKEILSFDEERAVQVEIVSQGRRVVLKKDEEWKMVEPEEAKVKAEELREMLRELSRLKADDLEIEKGPKECGLERPSAEVSVKLDDGTVYRISFGDESDGKRYLKAEGKEQIFMVYKYKVKRILKTADELKEEGKGEGEGQKKEK